jgi:FAD/FMN-containing dehydrogenase
MKPAYPSRRNVLKALASTSVIGALGSLRSPRLLAANTGPAAAPIPEFAGTVVRRQDRDYETWRQSMVWHTSKPARYPDVIVQARSEADVIAAVKYAAQNRLMVATHSGGHNATGASVRDGGMLLDVGALTLTEVDAVRRIASVQPGVRSLPLIIQAGAQGLCFPGPHCPTVGLGGFLMGGGIGWNYGHRGGVATFSIDSAEVVVADGRKLPASATENPDLLWAVRGGGPGFFGVVTRFNLALYPKPRAIRASSYIHSLENLAAVTEALDALMAVKDSRAEVLTLLMHNPAAPPDAPPEKAKICFVSVFAFGDSPADAAAMLLPFARSPLAQGTLTKDEDQEFSFEKLYMTYFGTAAVGGHQGRYACDSVITNEAGKAVRALADHFRKTPSPISHVLAAYGMNLRARDDACFSSIADHYVGCFAIWEDEKDDERNFQWLDQTLPFMDPYAKGHYVNEVEARRHPERIAQCYSPANWRRLGELRQKYDPAGVFHKHLGQA